MIGERGLSSRRLGSTIPGLGLCRYIKSRIQVSPGYDLRYLAILEYCTAVTNRVLSTLASLI